jgi:hypothetical protein
MSKWIVDIHGNIEGDYEIIKKYDEPTTKNDLGVDLISRADAIKAMQEKSKKLKNLDTIYGLCGAVAILYDMPSITPQEPILDKIRAEIEALIDWHDCPIEYDNGNDAWYCEACNQVIKIIDKYKACEGKE